MGCVPTGSLLLWQRPTSINSQEGQQGLPLLSETRDARVDTQFTGLLTQNVKGLGASTTDRDAWFRSLRQSYACPLTRNHVEDSDFDFYRNLHDAGWGFRVGPSCPFLSYWLPVVGKKTGVGVLVNPYGDLGDTHSMFESRWNSHFMAVTGQLHGRVIIAVNIYAPHKAPAQKAFFRELADLEFPPDVLLAVGQRVRIMILCGFSWTHGDLLTQSKRPGPAHGQRGNCEGIIKTRTYTATLFLAMERLPLDLIAGTSMLNFISGLRT
ncbi:reverse transcriptase [Phytophthora megakarya]|uniref:Reverse transcriptase n=1 Tax=Phytophthora megakarya TaxID=4795 RepID=A0A225WDD3_9STRA|nr:reverse transcriptase [Phytophthora megakarya]